MASLADLQDALRNADAAGDTAAATTLANEIVRLSAPAQPSSPQASQSLPSQLGRQVGLTARAGLGGLGGVANLFLDPLVSGVNAAAGTNLPIPSQAMERTLTSFGLPEPQNATERIAQAGARGMVPVAGSIQAGRAISSLAPLAQYPFTQLFSGASGGASSEGAKEAGAGPLGQIGAGLLGGVAGPTALLGGVAAGRATLRVPGSMLGPFTSNGRMNAAASVFQNAATDPRMALAKIQNAPEYVPGVNPTTAELANDSGISGLYKTLRNQNQPAFADIAAGNDAARQAYLAQRFGGPGDIAAAKVARDAQTTPLREAAFSGNQPVDVGPVVQTGNAALEAGAKYRGSGPMIQKFVNDISTITDPEVLYNGPRKAINDAIAGKVSQDNPLAQFTKQELIGLRGSIDDQIEKVAPGFKAYLAKYAEMSGGINTKQLGQDITQASTNPLSDQLSPAKYARQMQANAPEIGASGAQASDALTRVNQDLKRSVAPSLSMRTAGSDTTQNLIGNDMLQRAIGGIHGGPTARLTGKVLSLLYSPFEQQTRNLLLQGMIDPRMGAGLLGRPIPQRPDLTAGLLARRFPITYGGLLGTASAQ